MLRALASYLWPGLLNKTAMLLLFPRVGTDIYLGRQQPSQVYVSYVGVKGHISHLDSFFFPLNLVLPVCRTFFRAVSQLPEENSFCQSATISLKSIASMEKYEGRTIFQSINIAWENIIILNFYYFSSMIYYLNKWKFADNASDY